MTKISNTTTDDLLTFTQEEIKTYIQTLQHELQTKLKSGQSMDDILDKEDPFEALEPILPQEVYPILVLAMINDIRSDTVMEAVLEGLEKGMQLYKMKIIFPGDLNRFSVIILLIIILTLSISNNISINYAIKYLLNDNFKPTDLEISLNLICDVDNTEDGCVAIPLSKLLEITSAMPNEVIDFFHFKEILFLSIIY